MRHNPRRCRSVTRRIMVPAATAPATVATASEIDPEPAAEVRGAFETICYATDVG